MLMGRAPEDPGPALLFGSSRTASRSEIVSQLPSKYFCDLMVDRYFSTLDPGLCMLRHAVIIGKANNFRHSPSANVLRAGGWTCVNKILVGNLLTQPV